MALNKEDLDKIKEDINDKLERYTIIEDILEDGTLYEVIPRNKISKIDYEDYN